MSSSYKKNEIVMDTKGISKSDKVIRILEWIFQEHKPKIENFESLSSFDERYHSYSIELENRKFWIDRADKDNINNEDFIGIIIDPKQFTWILHENTFTFEEFYKRALISHFGRDFKGISYYFDFKTEKLYRIN